MLLASFIPALGATTWPAGTNTANQTFFGNNNFLGTLKQGGVNVLTNAPSVTNTPTLNGTNTFTGTNVFTQTILGTSTNATHVDGGVTNAWQTYANTGSNAVANLANGVSNNVITLGTTVSNKFFNLTSPTNLVGRIAGTNGAGAQTILLDPPTGGISGSNITALGTIAGQHSGNGAALTNLLSIPSAVTQSNTTYYCNLSVSGSYIINPTTNNIQFIATGMVAGASCDILLFTSTTNCTLSFDSNLTNFIGTPAPTLLSSNHVGELKLKAWDTTEQHVTLYWGSTVP